MTTDTKRKTTGVLPTKFQHLVIYTKDIVKSHRFYKTLFDLQFSAKNHPDSSAAMRMIKQTMHFFSFGYYHHDLAFAQREKLHPDNTSVLHFAFKLKEEETIADFIKRLEAKSISYRKGRLLQSAKTPEGLQAVCFEDPNGYWVEVIGR